MKQLQDYAFLWNNPADGWVLLRINRESVSLAVRFFNEGPNLRDVAAMRSAVPDFKAMSPPEAFAALKGRNEVALGLFESKEGRRLADRCRAHGLSIDVVAVDQSGYLPFNEKTCKVLIIEDDTLAVQVCDEALTRGLRIKHIEA